MANERERLDPTADAATEAALAVAARHALHDEEIVVAFASGTLDPADEAAEIERARGLIDRCTACQALHADIAAIGEAIRADARGTVTAPRDFRLSVDDARRLGGFVRVDGFLTRLRRSMTSFAKPLGASMATLGVVGVLIGSMSLAGGAATGLAPEVQDSLALQSGAPPEGSGSSGYGDPKSTARVTAQDPSTAPSTEASNAFGPSDREELFAAAPGPNLLVFGASILLLIAGIVLLIVGFRRPSSRPGRSQVP